MIGNRQFFEGEESTCRVDPRQSVRVLQRKAWSYLDATSQVNQTCWR
jgi:hypothetical protein